MNTLTVEEILSLSARTSRVTRADVCHAEKGIALAFSDMFSALEFQIHVNEQLGTKEAILQIAGLRAAQEVIRDLSGLAGQIAEETVSGQLVR